MITTIKTFCITHFISYSSVFLLLIIDTLQKTQNESQSLILSLTELLQLQLFKF